MQSHLIHSDEGLEVLTTAFESFVVARLLYKITPKNLSLNPLLTQHCG